MEADPRKRIAWQWDDGWTLVRVTDATLAHELVDTARVSHLDSDQNRSLWRKWDDDGLATFLFLQDQHSENRGIVLVTSIIIDTPTFPSVFKLDLRLGLPGWFESFSHFVPMVGDLANLDERIIVSSGLAYQFGRQVGFLQIEDPSLAGVDITSVYEQLSESLIDGREPGIFNAFAMYAVPGRCLDEECEPDLLLGNLPHLFCTPTRVLEIQNTRRLPFTVKG